MKIQLVKTLGSLKLEIDTEIDNLGICALFGRSGSGKTSLINMIAGLDKPDSGEITLNQQCFYDSQKNINTPVTAREIGYVFQQARLFPHFRVLGNLKYGYQARLDPQGVLLAQIIELLELAPLLKRYPADLSGGEAQRVAIGRALLRRPKLLLMDEPLAALDTPRKQKLMPYLLKLNRQLKLPIIYVTHSLEEVLFLADSLILIEQGKIIAQGDVASVWNTKEMQPWLDHEPRSSILYAQVSVQHSKYLLTGLALAKDITLWSPLLDIEPLSQVRIRIFARDVSITLHRTCAQQTSIRNVFSVRVSDVIHHRENSLLKLELGSHSLWAEVTRWACDDLALKPGLNVYAQIKGVSIKQGDLAAH